MKCLEGAIRDFMAKSGYNPNQPRVPASNADGGEWTSGGGGAGARGNKYAAAALGDVVFREGKKGAGEIMMNAVNATLKENKMPLLDINLEQGEYPVVREKILTAYSQLAQNPAILGSLLDNVAKARVARRPDETARPDYYRFEQERNR